MKRTRTWFAAAVASAAVCLAGGCIVSDQLTTITIHADGSADWVRFQSNVRSTEKGDKGAEELERFAEEFNNQRDPDLARIREVGGEIVESRWVRREEPFATLVTARFPTATALESFLTLKGDKGETLVETRFVRDGRRRRLTLAVRLPAGHPLVTKPLPTESERLREKTNGLSESRIAVSGGLITASRGFTVADDKRSALFDPAELQELVKAGAGHVELFLEWELGGA